MEIFFFLKLLELTISV